VRAVGTCPIEQVSKVSRVNALSAPTGEQMHRRRYCHNDCGCCIGRADKKGPAVEPDRRAFSRLQTRKNGKILFMDQPCFVECIIRNISEDGALLSMLVNVPLPQEILLWEARTGALYECDVRWRRDHMVGVHFVDVCGRGTRRILLERGFALGGSEPVLRPRMH
jgi:hypothetical protein